MKKLKKGDGATATATATLQTRTAIREFVENFDRVEEEWKKKEELKKMGIF